MACWLALVSVRPRKRPTCKSLHLMLAFGRRVDQQPSRFCSKAPGSNAEICSHPAVIVGYNHQHKCGLQMDDRWAIQLTLKRSATVWG
jgi:hypothetical protein